MSTAQENLEERIVRIRKRDEEIEKKHRAAEEDRLLALKHNAMVKTKSPTDDDWPKGHKYDSLDFTYDQNEQQPDDDKMSKKPEKDKFAAKPGREYKKFADGSGPPPDPTYNFLKDAERDGITEKVMTNEKKDWRQPNVGNNNSRNKNGLNNSFRGRNGKQQRNGNNAGGNRYPKHDEYGSWKNERDRIDESRIGRQKGGDGKWRREWDTDKSNEDDISNQMEKAFVINSQPISRSSQQQPQFHMQNQQMPQPQQQHQRDYQQHQHPQSPPSQQHQQQFHFEPRSPINNMKPMQPTQHLTETPMEKRGNIMVSVSQDGEVKSVKCKTKFNLPPESIEIFFKPKKKLYFSSINKSYWHRSSRHRSTEFETAISNSNRCISNHAIRTR